MLVTISGKKLPEKSITRKEARTAAEFFTYHVMGKNISKNMCVNIKFVDFPSLGMKNQGDSDVIDWDSDYPLFFEIRVQYNLSRRKQLRIIAHEMVHVKQFAKGELKIGSKKVLWKKKVMRIDMNSPPNYEDYLFWPWEVEAYGMEHGLMLIYGALRDDLKKMGKI